MSFVLECVLLFTKSWLCYRMMEMQSVLAELVSTFEFSLPDKKVEIQRMPVGVLTPMIKGELHKGAQMPLKIKLLEA
jgi:hypothetical protein